MREIGLEGKMREMRLRGKKMREMRLRGKNVSEMRLFVGKKLGK